MASRRLPADSHGRASLREETELLRRFRVSGLKGSRVKGSGNNYGVECRV